MVAEMEVAANDVVVSACLMEAAGAMAAEMEEAAVVRGGVVNMMKSFTSDSLRWLKVWESSLVSEKFFAIEATRKH